MCIASAEIEVEHSAGWTGGGCPILSRTLRKGGQHRPRLIPKPLNSKVDAENRLVWAGGYRYLYDAKGERVEKCQASSATAACPTSGTTGTLYWKGTGSDTLAETDLGGNDLEEYLYFNGQRISRRDVVQVGTIVNTVAVHYYFSDHLGSHGVIYNATGTTCEQDIDYYPYGGVENDYCAGSGVSQNYKFTGKERDAESGLDNFGKRYDSSSLGRFMTTDPVVITTERLKNPQQLNLYAYVANNPLRFIDPTGEILQCVGSSDQQKQCFSDLQQIAGDAANRLSMDAKTGVVSFDTSGLDLNKNAGAASLTISWVAKIRTTSVSAPPL